MNDLGENFDEIMDAYFENFKEKMQKRYRIPQHLVEKYEHDIFFLVDFDKTHIESVKPRIAWVKHLSYEVNIGDTGYIIESLMNELAYAKATNFGTNKETKTKISLEIEIP